MPNTMTLINAVTVGAGGASSIDFTSIPQTYTDLCIKLSSRTNGSAGFWTPIRITFNSSAATNFVTRYIYGSGSGSGSESPGSTDANIMNYTSNANNTANTFGNMDVYITNYTSASNIKSVSSDGVGENNATDAIITLGALLWNPATQAAITSISLIPYSSGSFVQYSTAYLYGIKNS